MKIVVSPNPYRDKQFKNARQACSILREAGAEVALCLPFDVDKTFEIPHDLRFQDIQKEIKTADMLICFGGDGTILHSSKIATEHNLPILGVNIGTMGFIEGRLYRGGAHDAGCQRRKRQTDAFPRNGAQ